MSALLVSACGSGGTEPVRDVPKILRKVVFETRLEIPADVDAVADASLVDWNNDGQLDLIVSSSSDRVQLLQGQGNGNFVSAGGLDVSGQPAVIRTADFDGDGDQDLAVLRALARRVSVYRNDGNGGYILMQELVTESFPSDVLCADCNRDGFLDLLVSHLQPVPLRNFTGRGDSTFAVATPIGLPGAVVAAALANADVTGDSIADLLVVDQQANQLIIQPGLTTGAHGKALIVPVGQLPQAIATGDLDGDGRVDIAVANRASRDLTLLYSRASGGYRSVTRAVGGVPGSVVIGDVTHDQRADLVVGLIDRRALLIASGRDDGSLSADVQMAASGTPFRSLVGDVDGDGIQDLLVTASGADRLSLFRGRAGFLTGSLAFEAGVPAPESVATVDLDGDGRDEVVVSGGSRFLAVLQAEPNSTRSTQDLVVKAQVDVGLPVQRVQVADCNADGRNDLIVTTDQGVKIVANMSSAGNLSLQRVPTQADKTLIAGVGLWDVEVADVDDDGFVDLIASDSTAQRVTVLRSLGFDFRFATNGVNVPVSGVPGGLAVADFDGDGAADIAVARNAASLVSFYRNDGKGSFSEWVDVPVPAGPSDLASADFDGDGRRDLVVGNAAVEQVTVLLAQSDRKTFAVRWIGVGGAPASVIARDLNGDGTPDIIVPLLNREEFRVLLGDGRGGFPTQLPFAGSHRAVSAGLGDVDGDSLLDFVVVSDETDRVALYRNISPRDE